MDVVDAGLVDTPDKSRAAARACSCEQDVDAIFLYISTYALSHTVLPVAQQAQVPVIVLNLQPVSSIDYEEFNALGDRGVMTGEWLAHCQACCAPEIANVFNKVRHRLSPGHRLAEGRARLGRRSPRGSTPSSSAAEIRDARIGILGHYYAGMLDVYTDVTASRACSGAISSSSKWTC